MKSFQKINFLILFLKTAKIAMILMKLWWGNWDFISQNTTTWLTFLLELGVGWHPSKTVALLLMAAQALIKGKQEPHFFGPQPLPVVSGSRFPAPFIFLWSAVKFTFSRVSTDFLIEKHFFFLCSLTITIKTCKNCAVLYLWSKGFDRTYFASQLQEGCIESSSYCCSYFQLLRQMI